ncbi:cryptochrome/photolyase family protein [Flavobacterium sp. CYK-55]|uniref:cryptochrome/photolyase family protein n=1 Tax=Flavobacterium sp. CYK-55 TaxID=2835529 RepID=UPI001BCDA0BF|nr:cryptochrome/photolyase family protein [Flavobacterium sp. CYK-55]MBS7787265.1 cryptochrome/photolyase family protein [Flavobacterium sp. CYK-55]
MKTLRLILGDQLHAQHSWYQKTSDDITYLMIEMHQETSYVKHHIQKITAFFAAMRCFAQELTAQKHQVRYFKIGDDWAKKPLDEILSHLIGELSIQKFEYQQPDEYRLDEQLNQFCTCLPIAYECFSTEHFLTEKTELGNFFKGKKQWLMESFYRQMRKKHHILMQGDAPVGGAWNFDHENRKKYKGEHLVPLAAIFQNDVREIHQEIDAQNMDYFGHINPKHLDWPINRKQCLQQLDYFCAHLLEHFGDYEDAMHSREKYLFHSRLSFAMNTKMLSPMEVIQKAIDTFEQNPQKISLPQIEGFVRQILGWREYVRGIYWAKMPEYQSLNYFGHQNQLPEFFWTGQTKMNCLKHAIGQSLNDAYAHHIQRLMVIGNFALLTQIHPDQVDAWYLGVYIDAIEWVEMPNTRGMSQYADGGIIATKPYVSSGSYIQKMSDYCSGCAYDVKQKTGEKTCPFNSLYWHFVEVNRPLFQDNPRMAMMYHQLNKMPAEQRAALLERAEKIIQNPDAF